jgi:hypothetical protein
MQRPERLRLWERGGILDDGDDMGDPERGQLCLVARGEEVCEV